MVLSRGAVVILLVAMVAFLGVMLLGLAQSESAQVSLGYCALIGVTASAMIYLLDQRRFVWAGRIVAAAVFLTYAAYLAEMLMTPHSGRLFGDGLGDVSFGNGLVGMLIFGLPALAYAIRGPRRMSSRTGNRQQ